MNIPQEKLSGKRIIILFFSTLVGLCPSGIASEVGPWDSGAAEKIRESEYLGLLDTFSAETKANYEKIRSWQGEFAIDFQDYYYDHTVKFLNIREDDPARNSSAVVRRVNKLTNFVIDCANNRIFVAKNPPDVAYLSLDLHKEVTVDETYSPAKAISTAEGYMHYEPDFSYGPLEVLISDEISGRAAFLDPPEKAKQDHGAILCDPREHFVAGHRKIWDDLILLKRNLQENGNRLTAGVPRVEIEKVARNGHSLYKISAYYLNSTTDGTSRYEVIRILDESVAYNMVHYDEILPNGQQLRTKDLTYERINDVFLPKTIRRRSFNDNRLVIDSTTTFIKSVLNQPVKPETFTIENLGLENGVRFIDNINSIQYIYKDGQLIRASALKEAHLEVLDQIAKDISDRSSKKTGKDKEDVADYIFLPKAEIALKRNLPFILDLRTRKLIDSAEDLDSEKLYTQLTNTGMGDIAWDRTLVTARNATIFSLPAFSLAHTSRQRSTSYKLPGEYKLPFYFLAKTKEGLCYLVAIHSINPEGIKITYRRITPDELENHKSSDDDSKK